jgi:oligoribonuclease NrnB/cAMP/cGMP phosphodiesterase (DHH superfamily)
MSEPNVLVLSHSRDIDGIGSAALLRMKYGMPLRNLFFSGHSVEDLQESARGIAERAGRGAILFVTDMGVERNPKVKSAFLRIVKGINAKGGRVIWLDHHNWDPAAMDDISGLCGLAIIGENRSACATRLVYAVTGLRSAFVNKFVKLVNYDDFNLVPKGGWYERMSEKYALSIDCFNASKSYAASQRMLRHMAGVISSRSFTDTAIDAAARLFKRKNEERIARMLQDLHVIGGRLAIGFAGGKVDANVACDRIRSQAGADMAVVVYVNEMTASARSGKGDVRAIAQRFMGGGHEHAAGFPIPKKYDLRTAKGRQLLVKKMESISKELGLI